MSELISRTCKCCTLAFTTKNISLEFCSSRCVETSFKIQQDELAQQRTLQMNALADVPGLCVVCGTAVNAFTARHTVKKYCGAACAGKGVSMTRKPMLRPCVHCNVDVLTSSNIRPAFVRCAKHRDLWPEVRMRSAKNLKRVKAAEAPFDQYLLRGPWWDHKKGAWTVLLMHSGASSKREMEYARYLLSVKEGSRLNDEVPVVYADGDRTNVDISNLALG